MDNHLLNIEIIKKCILQRKVVYTKHCLNRMNQRNILISDIKTGIENGKIIEYYYDDYPYPSCLVVGKNTNDRIIHIVCGFGESIVYFITAYYPDSSKWEKNMEIRKEKNSELF